MFKGMRCDMAWLISEMQVIRVYWSINLEEEN